MKSSKKSSNKAYYEMRCGCTRERNELLAGNRKENPLKKLACPEHFKPVKYKFGWCVSCGQKIKYRQTKLSIPWECTECNPVFKIKNAYRKRKQVASKPKRTKKEILKICSKKSDCRYRPLCLEVHIKKSYLPCYKCDDYQQWTEKIVYMHHFSAQDIKNLDAAIHAIYSEKTEEKQQIKRNEGIKQWQHYFYKREKDLMGGREWRGAAVQKESILPTESTKQ